VNYRLEVVQGPDRGKWCSFTHAQIIIGRDAGSSDLLLSDTAVSRRHARITAHNGGTFRLQDLGSTGGTFVNGTRISEGVSVGENDLIGVGDSVLQLVYSHELALASNGMAVTASISIGRDPANSLVIDHPEVSRQHALIEKCSDKYYLVDLGSTHGTFLDGNRISGKVELKPSQQIHIRGYNFFFDGINLLDDQGIIAAGFKTGLYQSGEALPIKEFLMIPFGKRERIKWLVGSLLVLIPILSFFGEGYRYRLMQNSVKGMAEMTEWDNWGELFIKGLLFFLVRLIYMILPALVLFLFLLAAWNSPSLTPGRLFLMLAPGLFIYLFVSFLLPMAWARFAATGKFKEAFNFYVIFLTIRAVLMQYLVITFFILALWVLVVLLSQIPYLGLIVAILGPFFIYIFSAFQYGDLYRCSQSSL